ncbi:response regulator [Cohnella sp.]|uniref:response regulator n=1 Tax=Cohnella sp. TaxID=1883426 RepID=UPI003562458D
MFMSLRFKIVIVIVLLNVISFAAINLINYEISNKQMNEQLIKQSMSNLKNTVANLESALSLMKKEVELVGRSMRLRSGTIGQKLQYLRDEKALVTIPFVNMGVDDGLGSLKMIDGTTIRVDHLPAYHQALSGTSAYSDPFLDANGKSIMWLMVPLYDSTLLTLYDISHQVQGVLGVALNSSKVFENELKIHTDNYKDSAFILIDRDTNVLYYKNESIVLRRNYVQDDPAVIDFAEQIRANQEGYGETEVFGRLLKMFYSKVSDQDWYLVFSVNKKEFEAPLRNSMWINILATALVVILLGTILYIFTERAILRRLKQAVEVTQKVASGDFYTHPLLIKSKDEMGTLASSINGMIENLQDLFEPFQAFIRHNQYAMIVTDSQFVITSYNKRAEEMLGYSENEVIGQRTLLLWHDEVQIQERARYYTEKLKVSVHANEEVLFVLSDEVNLQEWEWTWINRNGLRTLVSLNPSVMRYPDGTIKGYVLIARDISAIKKAVETNTRLLEIMESAHDMIASFDLRGHIFYLNKAGHSFLGVDSLNEQNNRLSLYMPIPTTMKFADGLSEAQRLGFWQSETEFIAVSGETHFASITVVAHLTEDNKDSFFSTIVRDISGQKEIERQLVKAKEQADEGNAAKSSFLARMSHEIRTPLNGIIGLAYLLQRSELTEIQEDYLSQITSSSQNLLHILNDILDFSKLEAGKVTIEQVPFQLEESLQRLSSLFSVLLGPKPVDFIIHVDPEVPDRLIGDPSRLEQILLNLGSNAIKFTNYGLIELRIGLIELDGGSACLSFTLKDTGIGMTPEQRRLLFMPFVQADEKTSRKYGGTGLGLVISHTLIESMGGTIKVESTYQVGSTFKFQLTFLMEEQDPLISIPHEPFHFKVLVLEDHSQVATHWQIMLSSMGCKVVTINTWEHAQVILHARKWDLFIVDMEQEDMHGEETWTAWKNELDSLGVKVISFTTLLGRDALQYLPMSLKPSAVLVKPTSARQVRQTLLYLSNLSYQNPSTELLSEDCSDMRLTNSAPKVGRILVVDDQIINRIVAEHLLEQQGFDVETVESGMKALQVLNQSSMDLVLMDLHMPDMDGIETTILLRNRFNSEELPIVALTADITEDMHVKCLTAGMNDIVTKPIQPEILFSVLLRLLPTKQFSPTMVDTDEAWPETPGLYVSLALNRLDGKSNLYLQLLEKFLQQYSDTKNQLINFMNAGDRASTIRLVHSLSGAAGHLGATIVQEKASTLERLLQSEESIDILMEELILSLDQVLETMNKLVLQKRS